MQKQILKIFFLGLIFFGVFILEGFVQAENYPLEIIQPQTGLDTTNRFYRNYPGLEYNVRLAVIGGDYPYTYGLTTAPSGMTINSATGEIQWDNPITTSSPHLVTVSVTDTNGMVATVSWTIAVTTNNFIFVSPSGNGTENGLSCANAKRFEDMYGGAEAPISTAAKRDDTYAGYFMYFCSGTYAPTSASMLLEDGWRFVFVEDDKPKVWLAYPGATPIVSASGGVYEFYSNTGNIYISGLTFDMGNNPNIRLLRIPGGDDNTIFYKNIFDGNSNTGWNGGNNALLFLSGGAATSATPDNSVIMDNKFRDLNGGIGLEGYSTNTMLVENNYFNNTESHSIYPKMGTTNWTIRGNAVSQTSGNGILVGNYSPSGDIEILYNYVEAGSGNALHLNEQYITTSTGPFYAHRNSLIGGVQVNRVELNNGPFNINYNAIEGSYILNSINYSANLDITNNIQATSGVIDDNGDLEATYSASVGVRGWQFADGSTPMELQGEVDIIAPQSPQGLAVY